MRFVGIPKAKQTRTMNGLLETFRRLLGTPLIFGGVVANRSGNFYAGVIL